MAGNCYNICYSATVMQKKKNRTQRLMMNYFSLTQHMTFETTRFNSRGNASVYVCTCVCVCVCVCLCVCVVCDTGH